MRPKKPTARRPVAVLPFAGKAAAGTGTSITPAKDKIMAYKLGTKPKTFKPFPVRFTFPDGQEGAIVTTFKYKTRKEFGTYLDELYATSDVAKPADSAKMNYADLFAKGGEKTVAQLLPAIDSWEFDYPLNKETLLQLQDEVPSAIAAFVESLRRACLEGHLGN